MHPRRRPMRPVLARRGQTLVLFALTLLLLVLMVCMTLSIGMKAREKMELETVADAAAYSNSVQTARAFNAISLMNRALMGHMVAMTGVESLISWSSYYRASIHGAVQAYDKPYKVYAAIALANCPCAITNPTCAKYCQCATQAMSDISQTQGDLRDADQQLDSLWKSLDPPAGDEALGLQISSISDEQNALFDNVMSDFSSAGLANAIAAEANKGARFGDELKALASSKAVNQREINGDENCGGNGAACTRRDAGHKLHFVYAAMGSRGYAFVTGRNAGNRIRSRLQTLMPARDTLPRLTNIGSGYFPAEGKLSHSANPNDATELAADDHGSLMLLFNRGQAPCPTSLPGNSSPKAHVRSTHLADTGDEHTWTGGSDDGTQKEHHTMGKCTLCPGMWPPHMDYNFNLVTDPGNNWGQPKSYAVIQRDYGDRPAALADPWNLLFRFRFSSSGPPVLFDNTGNELSTNPGTKIAKATALSAGITYYKRAGQHWKEPPNFLNPFWRATLVSAHVDLQGKQDTETTLRASAPFAADVYKALLDKEYMGW
ncbi:pilus assembly protein TadG-related protein [Archangium sp.]|uniref:pilus assembly protein TadG-related protein n=1 Tax=Archangium sp. TaxID=1872627 RepID=UPI00389B2696